MTQQLKLWLIAQDDNNGDDTYDSAVVAAYTKDEARNIHPGGGIGLGPPRSYSSWVHDTNRVSVKLIGLADELIQPNSIICASFNAGC